MPKIKSITGMQKPEKSELPRISDRISFLYVEKCSINRDDGAISMKDERGTINIPAAAATVLLLGPGTTVSHRAVQAMAEAGMCMVWVGEEGVRFYSHGRALNGSTSLLLRQAECVTDTRKRIEVARRMYSLRFPGVDLSGYKMKQMLGIEGTRVQRRYRERAEKYRVEWNGRDYDPNNFEAGSDINKAISIANACMYGVCHAVTCAIGLSPGLGFIHTGNELSFIHDLSDLYKMEMSMPVAFEAVSMQPDDLERTVRRAMRNKFRDHRFLELIVKDIKYILDEKEEVNYLEDRTSFWSGASSTVEGGRSYGDKQP